MSRTGSPGAAVSAPSAPARKPAAKSNARAAASRRNGARSRGPRTPEGKARSAGNALKHGMRAEKHVVLPQEDAAEFEALEAAILAELTPTGALQTLLARRVAVAAWRLERADRLEAEVLEFRSYEGASAGVALMRDGNGTRSLETLLRYRGAAMAELMRSLRMLKALQAEQAAQAGAALAVPPPVQPRGLTRPAIDHRFEPNKPERGGEPRPEYVPSEPPARALHEPAAPWLPNEPEPMPANRRERLPRGPARGNSEGAAERAPGGCSGLSSIIGK